jgi:hypothetical protein
VCGDRALDLDDVELVQMLLKEEKTDLDSTYALHYAAMYCDPKIMADLLRLKIAGDMHVCCKADPSICMFLFYSSSLLYWLRAESSGFYG